MPPSRYSTVYDLTSLRLHPDGKRVSQTASTVRSRKTKPEVCDSRGNWIARDAGGLGQVPKRTTRQRRARQQENESDLEGEVFDFSGVNGGESDDEQKARTWKGKGKARQFEEDAEYQPKSERARKRRKFADDLDFLDAGKVDLQEQNDTEVSSLPIPSSVISFLLSMSTKPYSTKLAGHAEMYPPLRQQIL